MVDVFTAEKRSHVMSRIRSHGNRATELRLLSIMREHHITGWRRRMPLPGRPDFAFRIERVAVFVDGCFWHGCPRCYRRPSSNEEYWDAKVLRNRARDRAVSRELRMRGWGVVRIWQHQLKQSGRIVGRLKKALRRE